MEGVLQDEEMLRLPAHGRRAHRHLAVPGRRSGESQGPRHAVSRRELGSVHLLLLA